MVEPKQNIRYVFYVPYSDIQIIPITALKVLPNIKILAGLCCLLFLFPEEALAQRRGRAFRFQNRLEHDYRPYHFGFSLGANTMNYALRPVEELRDGRFHFVLPEPDYGFHIGIVSNLKLGNQWDLRFVPTISFGDRYLEYYLDGDSWEGISPGDKQDLEVTLLEFPLHLKYKSVRMTNTRAYVLCGFKYTHDLASIELGVGDDILARVGRNDVHYDIGVGLDHYFYYFKFSAEIKASFGLTNLIRQGDEGLTEYSDAIDRLNSRSIMVSFTFE